MYSFNSARLGKDSREILPHFGGGRFSAVGGGHLVGQRGEEVAPGYVVIEAEVADKGLK